MKNPLKNTIPLSLKPIVSQIRDVEARLYGPSDESHRYIPFAKSARLLKVSAVGKALIGKLRSVEGNDDLRLWPESMRDGLKWFSKWAFGGLRLPCRSDLIMVRSHISLFCFDKGMRVKIQRGSPDRDQASLRNECQHRCSIPPTIGLRTPRIIQSSVQRTPCFFADEIISGRVLTWTSPEAPGVFEQLVPLLWDFYRSQGIYWATPREKGIDLSAIISDYRRLLEARVGISFPFDLDRISGFQDRPAPCSVVHGDVAVHNVILDREDIYLTDWELAGDDFIMRDFQKLLLIPHWSLAGVLQSLMDSEMNRYSESHKHEPLCFSEQLYLLWFLEVCAMLSEPDYPERRLRRAQKEMAYGVSAYPIG